tara:strand:- start:18867 stop:18989 length:123 start_codon:yes stop_codon:yes gene_type:complete
MARYTGSVAGKSKGMTAVMGRIMDSVGMSKTDPDDQKSAE